VWFDPGLAVVYRPRRSLRDLARQFHGSGRWRRQIVGRYPDTASFRYLAAPVVTACVGAGAVTGTAGAVTGSRLLLLGWAAPAGYAAGLVVASGIMGRELPLRSRLWLPVVTATMHLSWGAGFLRNVRD
jgi:succinoglycan biosynthesis protein ExoA